MTYYTIHASATWAPSRWRELLTSARDSKPTVACTSTRRAQAGLAVLPDVPYSGTPCGPAGRETRYLYAENPTPQAPAGASERVPAMMPHKAEQVACLLSHPEIKITVIDAEAAIEIYDRPRAAQPFTRNAAQRSPAAVPAARAGACRSGVADGVHRRNAERRGTWPATASRTSRRSVAIDVTPVIENEALAKAAAQGLGELLGLHEEPTHITRGYNYVILWVGCQIGVTVYKNGAHQRHGFPPGQQRARPSSRSAQPPSRSSRPSPAWRCKRSSRSSSASSARSNRSSGQRMAPSS